MIKILYFDKKESVVIAMRPSGTCLSNIETTFKDFTVCIQR